MASPRCSSRSSRAPSSESAQTQKPNLHLANRAILDVRMEHCPQVAAGMQRLRLACAPIAVDHQVHAMACPTARRQLALAMARGLDDSALAIAGLAPLGDPRAASRINFLAMLTFIVPSFAFAHGGVPI